MDKFRLLKPKTLKETLDMIDYWEQDAMVLSGGTDLIVDLNKGRKQARVIIDL